MKNIIKIIILALMSTIVSANTRDEYNSYDFVIKTPISPWQRHDSGEFIIINVVEYDNRHEVILTFNNGDTLWGTYRYGKRPGYYDLENGMFIYVNKRSGKYDQDANGFIAGFTRDLTLAQYTSMDDGEYTDYTTMYFGNGNEIIYGQNYSCRYQLTPVEYNGNPWAGCKPAEWQVNSDRTAGLYYWNRYFEEYYTLHLYDLIY